jgi:DnaJ-class molecular chaperone
MTCNDCKGSGKIELFTSTQPCKTCGGTGEIVWAVEAVESEPVEYVTLACGDLADRA